MSDSDDTYPKATGSYSNDWRKIRILGILKDHSEGCSDYELRHPPGGPNMTVSPCLADLIADGLIQVGRINSRGDEFYIITEPGIIFLEAFNVLRTHHKFRFKIFEAFNEDTVWPIEKEFAEGRDTDN